MACSKYTLTNTGSTIINFDYRRCDDSLWEYQVELNPGQTKNIWLINNTYTISPSYVNSIVLDNQGAFPFTSPTPTPSRPLPSPTPTPTGTPSVTPTPSPTPAIAFSAESIFVMSTLSGSNNYHYSVLDYTSNNILGPVDTGFPQNNTGYQSYPLTLNGYLLTFNRYGETISKFLSSNGTIMGEFVTVDSFTSQGLLNGKWVYVTDRLNGIFRYTDGLNGIKTVNFEHGVDFYPDSNYDNTTTNGFIVFSGIGVMKSYALINNNGITPIMAFDDSLYSVAPFSYFNGDFTVFTTYNDITGFHDSFSIISSTGSYLYDNTISADTYDSVYINFYGTNKVSIVYYSNNVNIPYLIWNYDGNTDTLLTTTHDRGVNYESFNYYYVGNFYPQQSLSENITIQFFASNGFSGNTYNVSYCDFLTIFDGDTSIGAPYVFQNSGSFNKWVGYNGGQQPLSFSIPVVDDSINLSLLTIESSGITTTVITPLTGSPSYNSWYLENNLIMKVPNNNASGNVYSYTNGVLNDSRSFSNYYVDTSSWNTFYYADDSGGYYMNDTNRLFTSASTITYGANTNDVYFIEDFKQTGNILLSNGADCQVITKTSIGSGFTFSGSAWIDQNYSIGEDSVLRVYTDDNNSGLVTIQLYDFDGNLLQSLVTEQISYGNSLIVKNRAYVRTYGNLNYYYYLVTPTGISSVIMSDNDGMYIPDDYMYWNQYIN